MKVCKLCQKDQERAKADANMCKLCYSGLGKYRRYTEKNVLDLTVEQLAFVREMEALLRHNESVGAFVPRFFKTTQMRNTCQTCLGVFKSVGVRDVCPACKTKEYSYVALYRRDPKSYTLDDYYMHYAQLYKDGRKVPELFINRHIKKTLI